MTTIDWQHVAELVCSQLFTAGVAWGTLRGELRSLRDGVKEAKRSADRAHGRIDKLLES